MRNKVNLIGRVGQNPEIKVMENGTKLAKFSLATNEYYTNKEGERIEQTEWHQLVAWGKTAELIEKLVQKGTEMAVEGKLTHRQYETQDHEKRYVTEVKIQEFLLLGKRSN